MPMALRADNTASKGGLCQASQQDGTSGAGDSSMCPTLDQEQRVRELFQTRLTIPEILEHTGLPLAFVIRVLNAPRLRKTHSGEYRSGSENKPASPCSC